MKWCRLYTEIIDDPKMAKLTGEQFRHFVMMLALATECEQEGVIGMELDDVAWRLRIATEDLQETMARLRELKILENGSQHPVFINWQKRQFRSDDSSERVKRYRAKQVKRECNGDVTPRARAETETETETEKEEDAEQSPAFSKIPLRSGEFFHITEAQVAEYESLYPLLDVRKQLYKLKKWNDENPRKRKTKNGILSHITKWLNAEADKIQAQNTFKAVFQPKQIPKDESRAQAERRLRSQAEKLKQK